jgi:hypothetical protein
MLREREREKEKKIESCTHAFRIENKNKNFKQGLIDLFIAFVVVIEANKMKTVHAKHKEKKGFKKNI